MTFQVHTRESAPQGSQATLAAAEGAMGFIPNLYGVFAESPALVSAYASIGEIFERSSLRVKERQVVLLTVSFENECNYCMAAHSTIAGMQNVPDAIVEAIRNGDPIPDDKLEALAVFTRKVVQKRGWLEEQDVKEFLDAGYARAQVLDVILGIGLKTLSNYTNHIADIPLDSQFQPKAWSRLETSGDTSTK